MIKHWETIGSKSLGDFRVFKLRSERKVSPRNGTEHEFFVIDCVNWVNVIAVTPNDQLVMVEQFRHGTNTVELEIPGGMMDEHEPSPVATAVRELREETGYEGEQTRLLGNVFPNPAIMSNTCFTVIIENCTLRHDPEFDRGEDLVTRLVPATDVERLIAEGKIRHSLVIVALYHFGLSRGRRPGLPSSGIC